MRNQTPLAPSGPTSDVTVYLVLNDFGPWGRAYCETDEAEANEATTIENLLSGLNSHPLGVVAFNTAEGWTPAGHPDHKPTRAAVCRGTPASQDHPECIRRARRPEANVWRAYSRRRMMEIN